MLGRRPWEVPARGTLWWSIGACGLAACSSRSFPPYLADIADDGGGPVADTGGVITPRFDACATANAAPSPDAQGLCGNSFLDVTSDPPNLYFIIDRSGSMSEIVEGHQKYDAVATAAVGLARSLGSHANVGAAVFPGRAVDDTHPCPPGDEVFPAQPGDPPHDVACQNDGPVTHAFSRAISLPSGVRPSGATPTAASLVALYPTITALKGRTVILLATDGGPNCNTKATCSATKCIANIEGAFGCDPSTNCCSSSSKLYGPGSCLDDDATIAAVASFFAKGIKTYVVGIPGSGPYAALLNDLAIAGGTARQGADSSYYDVAHIAELDSVLAAIGATVTLSCKIQLATPPSDSGFVNLYLDGQLVKYGPNGWTWGPLASDAGSIDATGSSDAMLDASDTEEEQPDAPMDERPEGPPAPHTEIDLVGTACEMLTSGRYRRLQVVFGCPTDIPR